MNRIQSHSFPPLPPRRGPRAPALAATLLALALAGGLQAGNEHWSRQFPKPQASTKMTGATGMSDGTGKPSVNKVLWHEGRLWIAGAWETGVSAQEPGKALRNEYWYLWTWSPVEGYTPICFFHSASGGSGPDGMIEDFLFLPDGRLVVGGAFARVDNLGGTQYHRVGALAVYDPKEPTANKWRPLGSFQYNGTISEGGTIQALAYDPQGNDLYIGGTFGGLRADGRQWPGGYSPKVHRYDLDTNSYEGFPPGILGIKATVMDIEVDTRTKPSTIYFGGKFHYTGGTGHGESPMAGGDTNWTTGLASWQDGKGWTTWPKNFSRDVSKDGGKEGPLQRAGDYIAFDSVWVRDVLLDGDDIWIVGDFSEGKRNDGKPLRGIARYDRAKDMWVDPTGKGGMGRSVMNIDKAANGKIYISGAFGGESGGKFFDGFKDGTPAHMAASFDPATGTWAQLGGGLVPRNFPECRMAVNGNDVYFVGDFDGIFPEGDVNPKTKPAIVSTYIARWNEDIDFSKDPDGSKAQPPKAAPLPVSPPEVPWATGNEHWSRTFVRPERAKQGKTQQNGKTGMDDGQGAPSLITGMEWHGDTLYFCGNWEVEISNRWLVWSYHPERGWERLSWQASGGEVEGPGSPPAGMKWHDGKLWVWGAISRFAGIGYYDPATKTWSPLKGTYKTFKMEGNGDPNRGSPIFDVAWDSKTGDMYMSGSTALGLDAYNDPPWMPGQVTRVDSSGVYHPMGKSFAAEDPSKPVAGYYSLLLDESKTPTEIYLGGTFKYYGGVPTHNSRMTYNVAKWSHADQDWRPLGIGSDYWYSTHDEKYYPDGLHGLPAHPGDHFSGFLNAGYPRVRDMVMDKQGNIYACGTLAIISNKMPPRERKESFGIAKLDAKTGKWGPIADFRGFSRDPVQMSWIDDDTLLLSGGMDYAEDWTPLNGVCTLNVRTGEMKPLGGGLMKFSRSQVIAPMVVHTIRGSEWWFGGYFQRAGINDNSNLAAPVVSQYVAMWDGTKNLDPNAGLEVKPPEPVCAVTGFSSKSVSVPLEASGVPASEGTIVWYDRSTTGQYTKKGQGPSYKLAARVKEGMTEVVAYVAVQRKDGSEGGPMPVRVPIRPCN